MARRLILFDGWAWVLLCMTPPSRRAAILLWPCFCPYAQAGQCAQKTVKGT